MSDKMSDKNRCGCCEDLMVRAGSLASGFCLNCRPESSETARCSRCNGAAQRLRTTKAPPVGATEVREREQENREADACPTCDHHFCICGSLQDAAEGHIPSPTATEVLQRLRRPGESLQDAAARIKTKNTEALRNNLKVAITGIIERAVEQATGGVAEAPTSPLSLAINESQLREGSGAPGALQHLAGEAAEERERIRQSIQDAEKPRCTNCGWLHEGTCNRVTPLSAAITISALDEARNLVHGDRGDAYGHPLDDFTKTARMWTSIFSNLLLPGTEIPPETVALAMVCVKLSRETNAKKRDNIVDAAGYLETYMMVLEERERREAEETTTPGTLEDAKRLGCLLIKKEGTGVVVSILDQYGAKRVHDLPESKLPEFCADLRVAISAAEASG